MASGGIFRLDGDGPKHLGNGSVADSIGEHCEVLAHHYVRSADQAKALECLVAVNRKAIQNSAMTEAKRYFDDAMTLLDRLTDTEANQAQRIL